MITGNDAANVLDSGGGNNDDLYGMGGNDTLKQLSGYARMYGGAGDDTYFVVGTPNWIVENPNEGVDSVQSYGDFTLGANFENLTLLSGYERKWQQPGQRAYWQCRYQLSGWQVGLRQHARGGRGRHLLCRCGWETALPNCWDEGTDWVISSVSFDLSLVQNANIENLILSGATAFQANGNALNNILTVNNSLNNVLYGFEGTDTLNGGAGNDKMLGGDGNDRLNASFGQRHS